jgi:hypothetical protein
MLGRACLQVYCWQGASYEGEVSGGLRHGYGRLTISGSPVVYEGQWQQGKRCGRGVLYYNSDKTAYYEGGCWAASACLVTTDYLCCS